MIEKVLSPRFVRNQNTPMTEHQYEELTTFSEKMGVNRADIMRTALAMYLEVHGSKQYRKLSVAEFMGE